MKSTEMFRSHALELEQRKIDWWWGVVAALALATGYGLMAEVDARREAALARHGDERVALVRAAYQQGLDDGAERACARSRP